MDFREFRRAGHLPTLFSAFLYFDVSFMVWILPGALANSIVAGLRSVRRSKGIDGRRAAPGRCAAASGGGPAGRSHRRAGAPAIWVWLHGATAPAGLALGRSLRQAAFGRAASGRGRGELRRRTAPGEPLVSAPISGAGDGDCRRRQQRNGACHVCSGLGWRSRWGWHAVFGLALVPLLATLALFVHSCQGQPEPSAHPVRSRITPA